MWINHVYWFIHWIDSVGNLCWFRYSNCSFHLSQAFLVKIYVELHCFDSATCLLFNFLQSFGIFHFISCLFSFRFFFLLRNILENLDAKNSSSNRKYFIINGCGVNTDTKQKKILFHIKVNLKPDVQSSPLNYYKYKDIHDKIVVTVAIFWH